MSSLHEQYQGYSIDQLVQALEANAEVGSAHRAYLENLLSVRTAQSVNEHLRDTADRIGRSANILKETLENSSKWLINAVKGATESSANSANQIGQQITRLTGSLSDAAAELKAAGAQSSTLGRSLNRLTAIIALAALISAAATAYYAWETKQQVDLMQQQIQRAQNSSNDSATPRKASGSAKTNKK